MSEHQLASAAIVGASFLVAATIKNAYDTTNELRDLEIKTNVNQKDNAIKTADAVYQSGMAESEMTRNESIIAGVTASCSGLGALALVSPLATPKGQAEVDNLARLTSLKPSSSEANNDSMGDNGNSITDPLKTALSNSRGLDADGNVLVATKKYIVEDGKLKTSENDGHTPEDIYRESTGEQRTAFAKGVNKEKDVRTTELSSDKQNRSSAINQLTELSKSITNAGGQLANSAVRANKAAVDKNQSLFGNAGDSLRGVGQKLSQENDGDNSDAKQAIRAIFDQLNNLSARG